MQFAYFFRGIVTIHVTQRWVILQVTQKPDSIDPHYALHGDKFHMQF